MKEEAERSGNRHRHDDPAKHQRTPSVATTVPSGSEEGDFPLVSVITISRENKPGLLKTRESVVAQTYPLVEHIVIDAASTDGTPEWLAGEKPELVSVSEPDAGRYSAMNKGSKLARGRLLWFLHAGDTFASPHATELVVSDWSNNNWRWAYGAARLVKAGEVVGITAPIPFRLRRFALGESVLPHQAACFEASLFHELGGYDEGFGLAADQLFMLEAAVRSKPRALSEFLCDFDTTGDGSTRHPFWHYYDSARARRRTGTTLRGGYGAIDIIAFLTLAGAESLKRVLAARTGLNH